MTLCFVSLLGWAWSPGGPEPPPTPADVRAAVRKSLPPLWEGGAAWRDKTFGPRKDRCASCHHVPFAVWTHHEALRRGFEVDRAKLDELTDWALDFAAAGGYRPELVDGFLDTLALAREGVPAGPKAADAYAQFVLRLVGQQLPDGSWKVWDGTSLSEPGMQVVAGRLRAPPPPNEPRTAAQVVAEVRTPEEKEAVAVDTMWTLLGVDALARSELPADAKKAAADSRRRALEWLAAAGAGRRSDWLALRAVAERRCGDPDRVAGRRDALLARQKRDGGWGLSPGDPSHPVVTGQCLFALAEVGTRGESPAVRKAWASRTEERNGNRLAYTCRGDRRAQAAGLPTSGG